MRKTLVLFLAIIAAVGAGAVTMASGSAESESPSGRWGVGAWMPSGQSATAPSIDADETFVLVGRETRFKFVDVDGRGETVGDYFLIRDALTDTQDRRVGRAAIRCMLQFLPDLQCDGALVLRGRGQLAFAVVVNTASERGPTVAITGGTEDFADAGGQFLVEFRDNRTIYRVQLLEFD